ncbi:DUF6918 family protein [Sandaracinus amylolyticus]|uniref:DUF6918 family protein n=1 Tax=Sandaracinus amylolyticus TaxID=927083 RepID=UPI001F1AE2B4|nr:hypothetical protein [Sandaracinus amylolyticus]UJR81627.1 Hypothetical protein I5071_36870 [Sandaracinus amylolyticus]
MAALAEVLTSDAKKAQVVDDCLVLIDQEVEDKGGISGMAIKAGYAAVKSIRPGFLKQVVTDLLPEFAKALDPVYQEARSQSRGVSDHFSSNAGRVADGLLAITDEKAKRTKSGVVKATYDRLRGTAKKNVESAVPRLGKLIEKHAG